MSVPDDELAALTARLQERERLLRHALAEKGEALLDQVRRSRELAAQAAAGADLDPLTGLFKHGVFRAALAFEQRRAEECSWPLGLVLVRVDRLGDLNHAHGYDAGDRVLSTVGRALKGIWLRSPGRREACFGREGGSTLGIALPDCDAEELAQRAEQVRALIEHLPVADLRATGSVGAAMHRTGESEVDLVTRCQGLCIAAAQQGGNAVALPPETGGRERI